MPEIKSDGNVMGSAAMAIADFGDGTDEIIENENRLVVRAHGVLRSTEKFLRDFVQRAMAKIKRPDLTEALGIILKELATNAVKANFKKIYFAEKNLNINNAQEYTSGMIDFRKTYSEDMFSEYGLKAKDSDLLVMITFDYDDDRVILEIRNNVPMTEVEESRARDRLRLAMQCEDVGKFIEENGDETEGAGLGIMLCITTLRSSNLNPRLLSISSDLRTHTLARLEIPISENYIPTRERFADHHGKKA